MFVCNLVAEERVDQKGLAGGLLVRHQIVKLPVNKNGHGSALQMETAVELKAVAVDIPVQFRLSKPAEPVIIRVLFSKTFFPGCSILTSLHMRKLSKIGFMSYLSIYEQSKHECVDHGSDLPIGFAGNDEVVAVHRIIVQQHVVQLPDHRELPGAVDQSLYDRRIGGVALINVPEILKVNRTIRLTVYQDRKNQCIEHVSTLLG
jgi:hypothetical protein